MDSLGTLTRNLLFTGKGGVGKTSIACATAVLQALTLRLTSSSL